MKEITITEDEFRQIASDVAAQLAVELESEINNPMKGLETILLTALFSAKLHSALFNNEELEVEE